MSERFLCEFKGMKMEYYVVCYMYIYRYVRMHCDHHFSTIPLVLSFISLFFLFSGVVENCIKIRFGGKFDIYFCAWYIYKSVLLCLLLFLWYCYWTMRLGYTHNTYKNYLSLIHTMLHGFEYYIFVSSKKVKERSTEW